MMMRGYRRSGSGKPSSAHRFSLAICRDQAKRADKQDFRVDLSSLVRERSLPVAVWCLRNSCQKNVLGKHFLVVGGNLPEIRRNTLIQQEDG